MADLSPSTHRPRTSRSRFSDRLVAGRGAWVALVLAVVVFGGLLGWLSRTEAPGNGAAAPADSESARVAAVLAEFPGADQGSVIVVATRTDGGELTSVDQSALAAITPRLSEHTGLRASGPTLSKDRKAAVLMATITTGADNTENSKIITDLRQLVADQTPAGMELLVTGGPAFGADVAGAFKGANFRLLAVTVLVVAVLLIATYRSPVLWLVPLLVVGLADQLANKVTAAVGQALDLSFDSGIISVLVFGAGANYALLLISRYREELRAHTDHRAALAAAWRATVGAILASNVTVVLSLLTLALAVIPGNRGLGIAAAVGLLIALAAVLLVLPPALAVCGRKIFWPYVPQPGTETSTGGFWRTIADRVVRRPAVALVAGLIVLGVMATGLIGASVGLTQVQKFRTPSESAAGLEVLGQHFDPGEAQPMLVVARSSAADAVLQRVKDVPGVVRAQPAGKSTDGTLTKLVVTGAAAPGTTESLDLVTDLRDAVHAVPDADALVGGATATDLDARAGNRHDLLLVAPLVLAVSFLVLVGLLRAVVAPVVLLAVNLVSASAAIGAGSWLSRVLLHQPALDLQVPLLSFLFLVALGIDYTIFLVHRIRAEAGEVGTKAATVDAVAHTGGVITSAGIVLAGVFAALGVLPLVTLGQLGLIVGVGVVVDTLLVRTVIVPALFALIGDRMWWPSRSAGRASSR